MFESKRDLLAAFAGASVATAGAFAGPQPTDSQHRTRTSTAGTSTDHRLAPFGPALRHLTPAPRLDSGTELWRVSDANAIVERASLSGAADGVWGSFNLNTQRLEFHHISGAGTPEWEFDAAALSPDVVAADGAENAQVGALLLNTGAISVHGFRGDGGGTPEWTYDFTAPFTSGGKRNVAISDDGSVVIAAAFDQNSGQASVVVLDGETGSRINEQTIAGRVFGVDIAADGSRAVLTVGDTGVVVDLPSLNQAHSLSTVGQGGWHRISGDGKSVAVGGFDVRVDRETSPGLWQSQVFFGEANNWFGGGVALSHDGSTFFVTSHNYATGYLTLTYRVFDATTGQQTAMTTTTGAGNFQDSVQVAHMSDDGSVMAVASWGTENNAHPEVQVFDADLNRIGEIDSLGSPFDMSLSKDGRYVVSGTKAVHANTFGRGGKLIVIDLGGGCYPDCDGSGALDIFDFLCFQDAFTVSDPYADCDGNTVFDIFDFLCFQDAFAVGCP